MWDARCGCPRVRGVPRSGFGTRAACGRAARGPRRGPTPTTWCTGDTAGRPTSTTWCSSVTAITGRCTRAAGSSFVPSMVSGFSRFRLRTPIGRGPVRPMGPPRSSRADAVRMGRSVTPRLSFRACTPSSTRCVSRIQSTEPYSCSPSTNRLTRCAARGLPGLSCRPGFGRSGRPRDLRRRCRGPGARWCAAAYPTALALTPATR